MRKKSHFGMRRKEKRSILVSFIGNSLPWSEANRCFTFSLPESKHNKYTSFISRGNNEFHEMMKRLPLNCSTTKLESRKTHLPLSCNPDRIYVSSDNFPESPAVPSFLSQTAPRDSAASSSPKSPSTSPRTVLIETSRASAKCIWNFSCSSSGYRGEHLACCCACVTMYKRIWVLSSCPPLSSEFHWF